MKKAKVKAVIGDTPPKPPKNGIIAKPAKKKKKA